jgi:hypothetical protein
MSPNKIGLCAVTETEATYRAAARWYTTQEILEQVKEDVR